MHLWEIYVICTHDDIKKVRFSFFFSFFFLHEYDSLISKVAKMTDIRAWTKKKKKKKSKMFSGFLDRWHEIIISFMSKQSLYSVFVLPEAIFKKKKMRHLAWLYVPLRNWNKDDFNNLKKDMLYVPSIHIFFFLRYAL